ncbi:hypothetical protein Bca4012_076307 [Brassica carinata]|uniref:RING-type domain-containing protein n=3 Tax=Brassica TaxID=3705 RepID=A0A0D3D4M1_BRAOL|nr:PREDICTED: probable E3 ubiquitin-protein ligase XERICO [Brassica oleracea var. oleracea]KAG2266247.1 hypothetical protein Bca52824_073326 [Brassica carinata]VDD35926.1 unnamed protein product [Brassica oleracea]
MGLSSLPGPSEGMLCVILVNTALSISIFKGILRSVLQLIGIRLSPSSAAAAAASSENQTSDSFDFRVCQPESFLEEFRNRTPTVKFESLCKCKKQADNECSVCLSKFEGDSEINKLKCGHLFHKTCLEKWIDYWNITCPLCRTPLVVVAADDQLVSYNVW